MARVLVGLGLAALLGCGLQSQETYEVSGTVVGVDAGARQVKISHDDIPGFMPAMTMNFDVADPALLASVTPGAQVHFELERSATLLRITKLEVLGSGPAVGAGAPLAGPPMDEPAPDFELTDHDGRPRALSDLRGSAVLLDFVFTRCNGPCPILTAAHASLQQSLPDEIASRTRFVSVSVDPAYDTPQRLRDYGETRGADLRSWSFLTGEPGQVAAVLREYGVGTLRQPDGTLSHLVITILIDPEGQIARRYIGLEHSEDEILSDLREILD